MIYQYFTDLSNSHDNYVELISFCKHFVNPTVIPTITRLIGPGSNGKDTLLNIVRSVTNAFCVNVNASNFGQELIDSLNLSKPNIICINECEEDSFIEPNKELLKNLPGNVHVVYITNSNEPLLATTYEFIKTIYMTQILRNRDFLGSINKQDFLQFIKNS